MTSSQCVCEHPPVAVGVLVILLTTAAGACWISELTESKRPIHWGIAAAGYAGLVGVVVAGVMRTAADITHLL